LLFHHEAAEKNDVLMNSIGETGISQVSPAPVRPPGLRDLRLEVVQSGGLAGAFVIPAVWLTGMRGGVSHRAIARDALGWMVAYLAMGTVFRVLA